MKGKRNKLGVQIFQLIKNIVGSFQSLSHSCECANDGNSYVGLPLGNLTSQLFVNIYMNEFDQFVKHKLKVEYYIRYVDDFVIFSDDKEFLEKLIPRLAIFLRESLRLELHPDKVFIKTIASGIDFLGWAHFPDYRVLRTATKRRMFRRLVDSQKEEAVCSYLGLLKHGNAYKLREKVNKIIHSTSSVD